MMKKNIWTLLLVAMVVYACSKEEDYKGPTSTYNPTVIDLNDRIPVPNKAHIPPIRVPQDNQTTLQGIALGRELFYEPLLSADGTMSCGTCHNQSFAFTDNGNAVSVGIDGIAGNRNSMHIINPGSKPGALFWDGRAKNMEDQALGPVVNPIEMHFTWPAAVDRLNQMKKYINLTYAAFGTAVLDSVLATKAIAQFERSLISTNSKYDRWRRGEYTLTPEEEFGRNLFNTDRQFGFPPLAGADCFHCHNEGSDFTDNKFHNNGLDEFFTDLGRADFTQNPEDNGKFKTPTLRNIEFTGPYMHDGRFKTLDEVIDFYSGELKNSPTVDPLMKNLEQGGVRLNQTEKAALKAFLLTFSDPDFLSNPDYSDPNQ